MTYPRPKTRADCEPDGDGPFSDRPCRFIACKFNIYAPHVDPRGRISSTLVDPRRRITPQTPEAKFQRWADDFIADLAALPDDAPTCSLDLGDEEDLISLHRIATMLKSCRELPRQVEAQALRALSGRARSPK